MIRLIYDIAAGDRVAANAALDAVGFGDETFVAGVYNDIDPPDTPPIRCVANIQMKLADRTIFETALTDAVIAFVARDEGSFADQLADPLKGFIPLLGRMSWARERKV
jgi:hypothetical protein